MNTLMNIDAPLTGREQAELDDARAEEAATRQRDHLLSVVESPWGISLRVAYLRPQESLARYSSGEPKRVWVCTAELSLQQAKTWLKKSGYTQVAAQAVTEYLEFLYMQAKKAATAAVDTGSLAINHHVASGLQLTNMEDHDAVVAAADQITHLAAKVATVSDRLELAARRCENPETGSWWSRRTERRRSALATLTSYQMLLASEQEMADVTAGFVVTADQLSKAQAEVNAVDCVSVTV